MKTKEILIIFVLAVLVTGLGLFYCVSGKGTVARGPIKFCGWPMSFVSVWVWGGKVSAFFWKEFLSNFLFWFLVLAAGWWLIKKLRKSM